MQVVSFWAARESNESSLEGKTIAFIMLILERFFELHVNLTKAPLKVRR